MDTRWAPRQLRLERYRATAGSMASRVASCLYAWPARWRHGSCRSRSCHGPRGRTAAASKAGHPAVSPPIPASPPEGAAASCTGAPAAVGVLEPRKLHKRPRSLSRLEGALRDARLSASTIQAQARVRPGASNSLSWSRVDTSSPGASEGGWPSWLQPLLAAALAAASPSVSAMRRGAVSRRLARVTRHVP